ncbi:M16 family metallopeptidase [Novosphingobium profundi]|uniref:M16 family metallopeptidase n=1 Tax=Novosphingobium profundi TaxID=1774954 RepID=UPI0031B9FAFB
MAEASSPGPRTDQAWAFEASDIPLDPAFRTGRLANGLRYVIRHNAYPSGTGVLRMNVETGSLNETPAERGLAHFLEHMAFNGSRKVPEGQMIPLLERNGLAFGADTNASTSFERTTYKLDLPRSDPTLLDTALMLMRETASNLTITPGAVARERGVILSEMRDRNTYAFRNTLESFRFLYPEARFVDRFAIGTPETIAAATSKSLRALYEREYVPANVTLVIVGDFDVDAVEKDIQQRFGDWAAPSPGPQPSAGPVSPEDAGRTDIYLDPSVSERLTIARSGPWLDEPDTVAQRQENLLRIVGYQIVNRRLQRLARLAEPPFRGAGYGTGDVFKAARTTRLVVDTTDGGWRKGLAAAVAEYRRALAQGFTEGEVAEQLADIRQSLEVAARSADTRSNAALAAAALDLVTDRKVPSTPQSALARFIAFEPAITPDAVLAAMKREALALDNPLIRFEGRKAPEGGAKALRGAYEEAMAAPLAKAATESATPFAYTEFGTPGTIVSDHREPQLGIREIRFANGVMLNLHKSDLEKDKVRVEVSVDGGSRLETRGDPTATEMASFLPQGGLGKHSRDELDTLFAGRSLSFDFQASTDAFVSRAATTPGDLGLQLELIAALITDPGYRPEGEVQYHQAIATYFAQMRATPSSALQADLGGILSGDDPRFTLQPPATYAGLTYARLKQAIGERLAHGAVEIALVGDFDEDTAIAQVARTFGALPQRESEFGTFADQPPRRFTQDRSPRVLHHTGARDQALLRLTWPTRDDADPEETLALELLERVMRVRLTDSLREAMGKTYSPGASSSLSRFWKGYGTFAISASVDVSDVKATRKAIRKVVKALRAKPVSKDTLARARQPLLESFDNALKTNAGWMGLVDHAQSQADRIERYAKARDRLLALDASDVQTLARRYLDPDAALQITVLPSEAPATP